MRRSRVNRRGGGSTHLEESSKSRMAELGDLQLLLLEKSFSAATDESYSYGLR